MSVRKVPQHHSEQLTLKASRQTMCPSLHSSLVEVVAAKVVAMLVEQEEEEEEEVTAMEELEILCSSPVFCFLTGDKNSCKES